MIGHKIESVEQLFDLSMQGKAVVVARGNRMPAAFVISMQACRVVSMIRSGMWLYVPRSARKPLALLRDGIEPGSWIVYGSKGNQHEREVVSVVGDCAYVFIWGGTAFVPLNIVTEVKRHQYEHL